MVSKTIERFHRIYSIYGVSGLFKGAWLLIKLFPQRQMDKFNAFIKEKKYQKIINNIDIKNGMVEKEVFGNRMKLLALDDGLTRSLLVDGFREKSATEIIRKILHGRMNIIEVGANQGYYLLMEASLTDKESMIYAFEPHPDNVKILRENVALNNFGKKCKIMDYAASDKIGTAKLIVGASSNVHHIGKPDDTSKSMQVHTTDLDSFCEKKGINSIDLLRMDVEGHEYEIIEGAKKILSRSNCILFIEFHTWIMREMGKNPETLLRMIKDLGFHCFAICGHNPKKIILRRLDWEYLEKNMPFLIAEYGSHMFFAKRDIVIADKLDYYPNIKKG